MFSPLTSFGLDRGAKTAPREIAPTCLERLAPLAKSGVAPYGTAMPFPASHPALDRALSERGYAEPTPVQSAVLEARRTRRACRATCWSRPRPARARPSPSAWPSPRPCWARPRSSPTSARPLALVIAPTRELAQQVSNELQWLYAQTGARIVSCVGGMDPKVERRALERGCPHRRRHARPSARPPRARRAGPVRSQGRRPRRGRRDAGHGLPGGPDLHPRRRPGRAPHPAVLARPWRATSSSWPRPTSATRCASTRSPAPSRTPTSNTRPSASRRTRSSSRRQRAALFRGPRRPGVRQHARAGEAPDLVACANAASRSSACRAN